MDFVLQHTRRHDLDVRACGLINITARVARQLDLRPGDIINIARSRDEALLFVERRAINVVGRHEAACAPSNERGHHFRAFSVRLARALLGSRQRAKFNTGDPFVEPSLGTTVVPIITRSAR